MTMSGAELQCSREFLGLPIKFAAAKLGTTVRAIHRWESGAHPVPAHIEVEVRAWLDVAQQAVQRVTAAVLTHPEVALLTSRSDVAEAVWPASWHRMVMSRAAERTGHRIEWQQ